jgi:hypothetical protein
MDAVRCFGPFSYYQICPSDREHTIGIAVPGARSVVRVFAPFVFTRPNALSAVRLPPSTNLCTLSHRPPRPINTPTGRHYPRSVSPS